MNTDQIAAEAVKQIEKCLPEGALRGSTSFVGLEVMAIQSIIQSAIEKAVKAENKRMIEFHQGQREIAYQKGWVDREENLRVVEDAASRAAHASEQPRICECGHNEIQHIRCKDHDECTVGECECDRFRPVPAHASDPVCTCNKENRGAGQHSSHCLAAQSAIKGATSATNVQLAAHASEQDDTKRLDWLENNRWIAFEVHGEGTIRESIDAAMRKNEQV